MAMKIMSKSTLNYDWIKAEEESESSSYETSSRANLHFFWKIHRTHHSERLVKQPARMQSVILSSLVRSQTHVVCLGTVIKISSILLKHISGLCTTLPV